MNRSIFKHLYPVYVVVMTSALLIQALVTINAAREQVVVSVHNDLRQQNIVISNLLDYSIIDSIEAASDFCEKAVNGTDFRLSIIAMDGTLTGDSHRPIRLADNHSDRPEVQMAYKGEAGIATRYSANIAVELIYYATPIRNDEKIIGVLRTALPGSYISSGIWAFAVTIIVISFLVLITGAVLFYILSQRISKPLWKIQYAAMRYAEGDLDYRFYIEKPDELKAFASSLNHMADEIRRRIGMVTRRSNELETVLSNMRESVIVLSRKLTIKQMNPAAEELFNVQLNECRGLPIGDVFEDPEMQNFSIDAMNSNGYIEQDFTFHTPELRYISANGTCLFHQDGEKRGVLLVFNDLTRIKKLESMRKDFVANVSHELRTPITSIKGFIETLLDGAAEDPETRSRFLTIISNHSERLELIISDLLSLSKLEENESSVIKLSEVNLHVLLSECIALVGKRAKDKAISISLLCDDNIDIYINPSLFQQAIINLLENGIKYSNSNTSIQVIASLEDTDVKVEVKDHGHGIPREDLPKIFQRFYRVDKARSRAMGGTGLGLAIVKHIVLAHQGRIAAESVLGEGSTFSIYLPLNPPDGIELDI